MLYRKEDDCDEMDMTSTSKKLCPTMVYVLQNVLKLLYLETITKVLNFIISVSSAPVIAARLLKETVGTGPTLTTTSTREKQIHQCDYHSL